MGVIRGHGPSQRVLTGLVLVFIASWAILTGAGYLLPDIEVSPGRYPPPDSIVLIRGVPDWVYGVLWIAAGALCGAALRWPGRRPLALGAVSGLAALWALSLGLSTWIDDNPYAWWSAIDYLMLSLFVYLEAGRTLTDLEEAVNG